MYFKKLVLALLFLFNPILLTAQPWRGYHSGEILQMLNKLNTLGSVLYVAAHPDDENTRLLSYLANERNFRTVYISLTRGDGGQNLLGKEQGAELGMIRTRELLEARRVDHAEQTFSMCNDFGYSKNPEETFRFWDRKKAEADVVWAIRKYRPDVIINRFPTTGEGGHGHHTASAILAVDAFRSAADSTQFSEQLQYVSPWQSRRILFNSFNFRNQPPSDYKGQIKLDVGGYSPLLGTSYGEMASESRSMHKSQGFGVARNRGVQYEHFVRLDGDTSIQEIFEGINTSWSRVKNGAPIEGMVNKVIRDFKPDHPQLSVKPLIQILNRIRAIDDPYWKSVKEEEVIRLIAACSGIWFDAISSDYFISPGDSISITVQAISRKKPGIKLHGYSMPFHDSSPEITLAENELWTKTFNYPVDDSAPFTNPYWLESPGSEGRYDSPDQKMIGKPWNESVISVMFHISVEGEPFSFRVPVNYKWTDPVKGELYRPLEIVPAVSLNFKEAIGVFSGTVAKDVHLGITCNREQITGKLIIRTPQGWIAEPTELEVKLNGKGKTSVFPVKLTPPSVAVDSGELYLEATFQTGDNSFNQTVKRIVYDHIPPLVSIQPCKLKLVRPEIKNSILKVGYIEGAGDEVAEGLKQLGIDVKMLNIAKENQLSPVNYPVIITGIRAFNTNEDLVNAHEKLMSYVENGGTLIVQYNTNNFLSGIKSDIGPYPFKISRSRVTDENAVPVFTRQDHFIFNRPNKITSADFEGWVQERGLYFASEYSSEYENLINWNDPGEKPADGALIIAKKGKGYFIYTGISFFRQIPAGVPGAYRLLINLINAGK
jgi:LmbE family N-acetylglucosaminyl deacetylase